MGAEDVRIATEAVLHAARVEGADSPVDYGDAEHIAKAVLAALRASDADRGREAIEAPENGDPDPEWRAIRRAVDQFVGRVPTIGKHRAVNNAHIAAVVARLDAAGDKEAADTIVWQCWWRALDRERERFLLADADERIADLRALLPTDASGSSRP